LQFLLAAGAVEDVVCHNEKSPALPGFFRWSKPSPQAIAQA
jgi:hypothetical protein